MKKLLIIIFLFISIAVNAIKYYVKSTGNNSNTGLSNAQAWATVSKVNGTSLVAGDSVFFNRGDVWREALTSKSGSAVNYLYYGAYGTGAKPLFLGSKEENSLTDWVDQGGNIWQNSDAAFTVDVGNIVFNNEESCGVKIMSATPTLDAQGEFWYDFVNDRIRIYSVGNPASVYTDIECVLKKDALNIYGKTYVCFQNMDFRYWGMCVWQSGGDYITFKDVDLSYIGGSDQYNDYTTRFGNGLQMWEGRHDITIERCRIDNVYDAGISPQGDAGGYEVYNIYMRNNIISNCEYSFEFWERNNTASAHDIYFENNTCVNAGGGWGHNQRPDGVNGSQIRLVLFTATKSNIYIRNNILYCATERLFLFGTTSDITNIVLDYNVYYQPSGGVIGRKGDGRVNYYTLATWKAAISQEAHSIGSDPLFVTPGSDYHLQVGSPAIGKGLKTTGITTDYDGNTSKDPPSIGAYDYDSKPTSPVIIIYPNPAHDFINISIEDPTLASQIIKIIDLSGKIIFTDHIEQGIKNIQIPENLKTGIYIVTLESGSLIPYAQKLIINK